jgi:DNA-binding XRE family transcriptional regulator
MKKVNKIPRIIKINEVSDFMVSVAFNNGEYRLIDFKKLFEKWKIENDSFQSQLLDQEKFNSVRMHEGTLQWPMLKKTIKLKSGKTFEVMFDVDPIVMYDESEYDEVRNEDYYIGSMLKKARLSAGLTQEELALRSGTTKNYISRIENNKSDIEFGTLKKIIEIGLDKRLELVVK